MPQEIDLSFVVSATDSGGLGVTSVKSNGWVRNVFMHTTATPGVGEGSITNPNPASGYAWVQFKQNFNVFLGFSCSFQPPTTGGSLTSLTSGTAYVINTVGSTTAAQWQTAGLPIGFTPAVGQSFVAKTTASLGGSGTAKLQTTSGIYAVELVGDPSTEIANSSIEANGGAWLLLQFLNSSAAATAPTASSVANLRFFYDRSSVTIDGL